jgi:hypothetical protein
MRDRARSVSTVQFTIRSRARVLQRFEPRPPHVVLERGFGNGGHVDRIRWSSTPKKTGSVPGGQFVARAGHEADGVETPAGSLP